jgi:hypothetical protein
MLRPHPAGKNPHGRQILNPLHRRGQPPRDLCIAVQRCLGIIGAPPAQYKPLGNQSVGTGVSPPVDPYRKLVQRCLLRAGIGDHHDYVVGVASFDHLNALAGTALAVG